MTSAFCWYCCHPIIPTDEVLMIGEGWAHITCVPGNNVITIRDDDYEEGA